MKYNIWKDCRRVPLPELLDFIVDNRGKTVPTVNQNEACNVVLIATNCIRNENLYPVYEKIRFISEDTYKTWFRSHPIPGDIIFVNKGTPGRVCLCPDIIDFCIAQDMMAFRVDSNKLYNEYLLAVLRSRVMQEQIRITSVGDTIPHFKKEFLKDLYIPVPPMEIQRIIGDYYYNLSQKIELNKKINENLEQQAQAIYTEMFNDNALEAWQTGTLSDIAAITMGQSPKGDTLNDTGKGDVFYQGRTDFGFRFPTRRLYTTEPKRIALYGDALMSVRAPVGDLNVAYEECCIGRGLAAIHSRDNHQSFVLYTLFALKRHLDVFNGEGTVFGSINKDSLNSIGITIPPIELVDKFESIVNPIDRAILNNYEEICRLQSIRDSLLPKLMNGEIDVSQVKI